MGFALAAIAAPTGCGEEHGETAAHTPSAPESAETAVRRYFAAFARGDARAVCKLMTDAGRQGMEQLPEGERAGSCERAVAVLARDSIRVRRPQVHDLRVSGRTATANVTSDDPPYQSGLLLSRDGEGWKIAYPPGFLSRFDSPPGIRPHEDEHQKR
jgi:hypothetical protein